MNILKFIANRMSTATKDTERNAKVLDGIVANIDSARGIARVLHTKAYNPWTQKARKELVAAFEKRLAGDAYAILTEDARKKVILQVANDTGRSPCAVMAQLRSAGKLKVRGSKDVLKGIKAKADGSKA